MKGRTNVLRPGVIALGGSAAALVAAFWAHATPGNDGYAALARAMGGAKWLGPASYKPLETVLTFIATLSASNAPSVWIFLGCLHVGLIAVLTDRLVRALFDDYPAAGVVAAFAVAANPYLLELAFPMNSVVTLTAALLFLCERLASGALNGALAGVALVALSRVDGLPVAAAGAGVLWYVSPADQRKQALWKSAAVLTAAVAVWAITGLVVNGSVGSIIDNMNTYSRAAAPVKMSPAGFLIWFRGGWYTMTGDGFVLMAMIGAVAVMSGVESRVRTLSLAVPVAAHALVMMILGLAGKPAFYRFLVPHAAILAVLASGGLFWVSVRLVQSSSLRVAAFVLLFTGVFASYAGHLRALGSIRSDNAAIETDGETVIRCLEPLVDQRTSVVVPDRLHGPVLYHFRASPVREVTYGREFRTRTTPTEPPVLEVMEPGGAGSGKTPSEEQSCGQFRIAVYR